MNATPDLSFVVSKVAIRPAHFSRFGFLARCEKKRPVSREKLREMREIICTNFWAVCSLIWPELSNVQGKITSMYN